MSVIGDAPAYEALRDDLRRTLVHVPPTAPPGAVTQAQRDWLVDQLARAGVPEHALAAKERRWVDWIAEWDEDVVVGAAIMVRLAARV